MTTIPSERFSEPNWLELHLKHCSFLTNNKCGTILIGDSIVAGLSQYQNIWNGNFSFYTLNCGIGGDKVLNISWRTHNLPAMKRVRNVVILCDKNNLHLMHLKLLLIVSLRLGGLLKGSTLMLIFLFANFPPWLLLVDKPILYKRCKWNFEIKCVWFSFSYIGYIGLWPMVP